MLEELQKIRTAAQLLSSREPELTEPLLGACATLWKQIYERSDWPADLEARARQLANRLSTVDDNVEETVKTMDSNQTKEVARSIIDFAHKLESNNGALV